VSSTLSVREVASRYAVSVHTVLTWIGSAELRAVNVARHPGAKRRRWRVTAEALAAWELTRTASPPLPRARRRRQPAEVIEFYK
jgi:excisionase family DNA binding protein